MDRPYIICHMTSSIDGKVTGEFLQRADSLKSVEVYYRINREYLSDGFICGRVTMEESFTGGWYPDLSSFPQAESLDDYICPEKSGFYAVAFDTLGRLGWKTDKIIDPDGDEGYHNAQIIQVLSEGADKRYLSYLRQMGISYIFAGEDYVDVLLALKKLKKYWGIKRLLLEGGSQINGSFACAGLIDEISLVVDPVVGGPSDKPLFSKGSLCDYSLKAVREEGEGVIWLNYVKS